MTKIFDFEEEEPLDLNSIIQHPKLRTIHNGLHSCSYHKICERDYRGRVNIPPGDWY
jgi:hypothetical protein